MSKEVKPVEKAIPVRIKRAIMIAGVVLAIIGLPPGLNLFCFVPFSILSGSPDIPVYVMVSLMLVTVTLAAGGVIIYHSLQGLKGNTSRPIRLPSTLFLMDVFGLVLIFGLLITYLEVLNGLLIPPLLFLAATLPTLWAISYFIRSKEEATVSLNWRRGLVALSGGMSISLLIAILLEFLLSAVILVLGFELLNQVINDMDTFFRILWRTQWTSAWIAVLTSPGFIYVLVYFTLIAPLVEEFAMPLVSLPILRYLNRQETFLVGAIAGAGFAMLENNIYATIGFQVWVEFTFIRALGSAIQPFGSGLVALGWRTVLRREQGAWTGWVRRFGMAVALHAAWNAASLLVVLLFEVLISGNLLREMGLPGVAALGMLIIFLALLGSFALRYGRALSQDKTLWYPALKDRATANPASLNRALAIWALVCLLFILPAGVALTRIWLR